MVAVALLAWSAALSCHAFGARLTPKIMPPLSRLVFDECEGLLGTRTDQSSSTDRYANMDVQSFLYHLEHFPGVRGTIVIVTFEERGARGGQCNECFCLSFGGGGA